MNTPAILLSMPGGSEWLLIILALAMVIFWIKTIIEIATSKFYDDGSKITWLVVTIFLGVLGAILYTFFGRASRVPKVEEY